MLVLDPTLQIAWQRDFGITGTNTGGAAAFSRDGRFAIAGTVTQAHIDDLRTVVSAGGLDGYISWFRTP